MCSKYECGSCGSTGVYSGFAEPKGTAVVCLTCKGTGAVPNGHSSTRSNSKPFTALKRRDGIHTVRRSRGSFVGTGVGPTGGSISYEDFLSGVRP